MTRPVTHGYGVDVRGQRVSFVLAFSAGKNQLPCKFTSLFKWYGVERTGLVINGFVDIAPRGNSMVIIGDVNVHVDSIANDYDASRIGDMAVERMIGIARKSGSRSVSRR